MAIVARDMKPGDILRIKDKMWIVCNFQHVKPGKGGAFMQTALKELMGTGKIEQRLRVDEEIDLVDLETVECELLYEDDSSSGFVVMRTDNFEEVHVPYSMMEQYKRYLSDNIHFALLLDGRQLIGISFPETIVATVVETEPVIKKQTASSVTKNVITQEGLIVKAPPHVEVGTKIVIKTEDGSYVRKA